MYGRALPLVLLLCSLVSAGCVSESSSSEDEVGSHEQPIFNGTADTTHTAVVAVLTFYGQNVSSCSGTIVGKDSAAKKAYVLTAAHCIDQGNPPDVVVVGNNWQTGTQYSVIDHLVHDDYNPPSHNYDFAMVTLQWSNAQVAPPDAMPRLTSANDNLAPGTTVDFVGYGVTENNDQNTVRRHKSGPLETVMALVVEYDQTPSGVNGGPCFGDSGGPALYLVGGVETVAAVTSAGDQTCMVYGVSGRVSAVDEWIDDYIANGGGGEIMQTCDQCVEVATAPGGACIGVVNTCLNDSQCNGLVQCLNGCDPGDQPCVDACVDDFPNGVDPYLAIFSCLCETGCAAECAGDPLCESPEGPECGFTAEDPACLSCFEGNCCAQGAACAGNQPCVECVSGEDPDPNCVNENVLAAQFYQCLAQKCGDECGIQGGGGSGSGGSGSGAGGGGVGGAGQGGGGVGAGDIGGAGPGGGGVGAEGGGVGAGNGSGAGNNSSGDGGNGDDTDDGVSVPSCACRSGAGGAPNGDAAFALGAALFGLFAARRKRR